MTCNCPADGRRVPKEKRVTVLAPGAVTRMQDMVMHDHNKVFIFHADCPVHGYKNLAEETDEHAD
jgi:hypothetical protein